MPGLIIWKNQEFNKLRKDVDRMFDRLWGEFGLSSFARTAGGFPKFDLVETEKNLIVKVEVPGIDPDNIDIAITENSVRIKGELKQDTISNKEGFVSTERRYGSFSRTLQLPCRIRVDKVKAAYKKGILNIIMPKYEQERSRVVKVEI